MTITDEKQASQTGLADTEQHDRKVAVLLQRAIGLLEDAHRLQPENPDPYYFEGLAYIGAGQYWKAKEKLEAARRMKIKQKGHSAALVDLRIADAWRGLGYYTEAISQYRAIIRTYKSMPNDADLVKQAGDDITATEKKLADTLKAVPQSPNLYKKPADPTQTPELPVSGYFYSGIGYNDNITKYGRGTVPMTTPTPMVREEDVYNESSFEFGHDWRGCPRQFGNDEIADLFSIYYVLVADTYGSFRAGDRFLQTVFANYTRVFDPDWALIINASDQWLLIDQLLNQNRAVLQLGIAFTPIANVKLQLNYYFSRIDGFEDPGNGYKISDGFDHRIEAVASFPLYLDRNDGTAIVTAQAQYAHEWMLAVGAENRYQRDDILTKISWEPWHAYKVDPLRFIRSTTLAISNEWLPDRYRHDAFPTENSPNPYALRVDTDTVTVAWTTTMLYAPRVSPTAGNPTSPGSDRFEVTLEYMRTMTGANVASKIYNQNILLAFLKVNF